VPNEPTHLPTGADDKTHKNPQKGGSIVNKYMQQSLNRSSYK